MSQRKRFCAYRKVFAAGAFNSVNAKICLLTLCIIVKNSYLRIKFFPPLAGCSEKEVLNGQVMRDEEFQPSARREL